MCEILNEKEIWNNKKLVDNDRNKERAAITLGCTVRHINRLINVYKAQGKECFIHENRGRRPIHTMDKSTKQLIVDIYKKPLFRMPLLI